MYWYGFANKACCSCWKLSSSFFSLPDWLPMGVQDGGLNRQPSKGQELWAREKAENLTVNPA